MALYTIIFKIKVSRTSSKVKLGQIRACLMIRPFQEKMYACAMNRTPNQDLHLQVCCYSQVLIYIYNSTFQLCYEQHT